MSNADKPNRNLIYLCACFIVDDVVKSAEYETFSASPDRYWGQPPCFVILQREGVEILLSGNGPNGLTRPNHVASPDFTWDAYIRCHDADALYAEFKSKDAQITRDPEVAFYEMKEFELQDCNGYILCFAHNTSLKP